jgi:hypothetical protein
MGRRRQRKRERRGEARVRESDYTLPAWPVNAFDPFAMEPYDPLPARFRDGGEPLTMVAGLVCGRCREFVPNAEIGRGECLHPGSGVLHPWDDTPACSFYSQRRAH